MKPLSLEGFAGGVPEWSGRRLEAVPISGGITNRALQVRADGRPYFVSIPGPYSGWLAIPRAQEVENARRAAETGVSPRVLYHLPESGVLVVEWVEGRTLAAADLHDPGMMARAVAAARRLHGARSFVNDFDLFRLAKAYRRRLRQEGMEPPAGYDGYGPLWEALEAAARARPEPPVPCSNDLVPENLIDDGDRLWIVDFGYSGNNDPCSELGNAAAEWALDPEETEALCHAYFGAADPQRVSRIHLYAVMSDSAWSLWSVIQEKTDLDFDFKTYGAKRWGRAREKLDSVSLRGWIDTARRPPEGKP